MGALESCKHKIIPSLNLNTLKKIQIKSPAAALPLDIDIMEEL